MNRGKLLVLLISALGGCGQSGVESGAEHSENASTSETRTEWPESLLAAAAANDVVAIKHFLDQDDDIDRQTDDGVTALIVASNLGNKEAVQFLIEHNARLDLQSRARQFTVVVDQGSVSDILAPVVGGTALHEAASQGHLEVVQLLVEAGADIDSRTSIGAMPLHVAAEAGHASVVEFLVNQGAGIDDFDGGGKFGYPGPPVYYASWAGRAEVIRVLIALGADVDNANQDLDTPLMVAARRGKLAAVLALLEGGASIDKTSVNEAEMTALIFAAGSGQSEVVEALLNHGANIEAKTTYGTTALAEAASSGTPEVIRVLLRAGADTDVVDDFGRDIRARAQNNPEVLELLD